jgi:hypothetical protein
MLFRSCANAPPESERKNCWRSFPVFQRHC